MGVWKERGQAVYMSSHVYVKPCGHLNVYVSGRLDVRCPGDSPAAGGSGGRYSPFSICTKSHEKVV